LENKKLDGKQNSRLKKNCDMLIYFLLLLDEDNEWDKELTDDLNSISAEELEKEINQMIGKD
jgi:hypothetical protein